MSVHKTEYGTYQVRWYDKFQKVYTRTFKLKGDADRLDREIKNGRQPHLEKENPLKGLTFADFAERWIKDYCEVHQSYGTIKVNRNRIKLYFLPLFGQMKLEDIRPIHVSRLQRNCLVDRKLVPSTINQVIAQFRKMMDDAVTWDLIKEDPSRKIKPLKVQKKEFQFWTFVEVRRFLAYCKSRDPELYQAVAVSVNTGLRRGELQGLLRDCVDFERKEILVKRTFCHIERKIVERTKTQRSRRIELNEVALAALADCQLLAPNEPVIKVGIAGLMDKRFPEMCVAAGVSKIRWHDLRHTFASHMVMAGKSLPVVQEVLGHQSQTMTERYAHLQKGFSTGATSALNDKKLFASIPEIFRQGEDGRLEVIG